MGKAFEKQIKTIEDQGKKQVDALKVLESKAIESGSNNKPAITQEFYDTILDGWNGWKNRWNTRMERQNWFW